MFSDEITNTDVFLDMPTESQLLYFHLGMNADDDGFIANTKIVQRTVGASDDSLKLLFLKKFLIPFESGVCVIKHWRINNQIRKDRYRETKYIAEKSQLYIRENGAYTLDPQGALPVPRGHFLPPGEDLATNWQPNGNPGKVSIGKVSRDKSNTPRVTFTKPTVEEVAAYCKERNNNVDPQQFVDHYESNGWRVGGRSAMKDWKASVRTWEKNNFQRGGSKQPANVYKNESNGSMDKIKAKVTKQ